jgi:radical SAM superfamily enzyme YgiQ (UPF0313 family)
MGASIINTKQKATNLSLREYGNLLRRQYGPNKKVLFVQIPQLILKSFNPDVARRKGYYAFPPTGLQYLYEAVKTRDLDIRILDLNFLLLKKISEDKTFDHMQWITIFEDYLKSFDPFIIGISCMYDSGIQMLIKILEFLKKRDQSVVIAGGVIPTYEWKSLFLRKLCHFVVKGEGENKINYLFDHLTEENRNFDPTPGICYKYRADYFETEGAKDEVAVNTDLVDSYSLVEIAEYYKYGSLNPFSRKAGLSNSPFAVIQMNRGCRGVCTFCSVRDFVGRGVRNRPVDKVLAEMEFLINKYGIRHFEWLDDDLLFLKNDFQLLLETIIKRGWNITWSTNNGLIAASIDDKTMQLMKDSGCIGFKIGVETGNAELLQKIKKPATLDTFRKVSRIFHRYPELFVGGYFMLGFPDEEFRQMMDTFHFCLELELDWNAFILCQAIRGATAFSDFEGHFNTQINLDDKNVSNFIPTRESSDGQIFRGNDILENLDVFKIAPRNIPGKEQIKEIWFTFNLVVNYINNKNLKPGGSVDKFISWVEMAQAAYPANPYMSLFLSLAYIIKGEQEKSEEYHNRSILCHKSDYWTKKFIAFGLMEVLNNFPGNRSQVLRSMERLQEHCLVSCPVHS